MLGKFGNSFKRKVTDGTFDYAGFRFRGRRDFAKSDNRVLLLTDAYGPTLQINFIRPLQRHYDKWSWLVLTETAVSDCCATHGEEKTTDMLRSLLLHYEPDVVVATRYGGPLARGILDVTRSRDIPLIFHIDDNLFAVPETNGGLSFAKHSNPRRQDALRLLLSEADLRYVSTEPLRQELLKLGVLGKEVIVAEIAGAAEIMAGKRKQQMPSYTFGYMGSQSHSADLEMIAPAIGAALQRFPVARFEIFGSVKLPPLLSKCHVVQHRREKNYDRFLQRLSSLDWQFGLAPLALNEFTLAKTNTKWVEYTSAGIPVLASDHPIYSACCRDGAGILTNGDWQRHIELLIEQPGVCAEILARAQARLNSEYSLDRLYAQLMTMFKTAGEIRS